jgi:ParB family chromosome partitioning protein
MTKIKSKGLGKGLGALLQASNITREQTQNINGSLNISYVNVSQLVVGKYQPRRIFNEEEIEDLANSIKLKGVIQPIVVRKLNDKFEIVAGERRYRAAKIANLDEIPAIIRELSDADTLAIALIENIQRKDLSIVEEASAYKRLIDEFSLTQDELANIIGKSRSHIANIIRLLNLEQTVQQMLVENKLSMGHARALLVLDPIKQLELANIIYEKSLTTQTVEDMVHNLKDNYKKNRTNIVRNNDKNIEIVDLESKLSDLLGMFVNIKHAKDGKGKIIINYSSLDEMDNLLRHFL